MGVIETASGLRASFEARRACWGATTGALVWQPPPPVAGDPSSARRLTKGILLFDGALVEMSPDASPWEAAAPNDLWRETMQGHGWIDDLMALGDPASRAVMIRWVHQWITTYGQGKGPGWTPRLVARRLVRWIAHSTFLLSGASQEQSHTFFRAMNAHARFLDRLWGRAEPGMDRIETVAGMLYARLSLEGAQPPAPGIEELGRSAARMVDEHGCIASRNPQDVCRLVEVLQWASDFIRAAELRTDPRHDAALTRLRPVLASLVHSDGRLARFHGGRAGRPGAVEAVLGRAERAPSGSITLGFLRMYGGGTSLLMDAGPPGLVPGRSAHASALAIEFTDGAYPVIVNSGSGTGFGAEAEREGRATRAHSTVSIGAESHPMTGTGGVAVPVSASRVDDGGESWVLGESHAWHASHGLVHERRLSLDDAENRLSGEDTVVAGSPADRTRLADAMPEEVGLRRFDVHFVLHPDARVASALNGRAALITLRPGSFSTTRTSTSPGTPRTPASRQTTS
ncbi:MAG: heparinase II/III family protein, partial [Pseudomonadota bacterium]